MSLKLNEVWVELLSLRREIQGLKRWILTLGAGGGLVELTSSVLKTGGLTSGTLSVDTPPRWGTLTSSDI